MLPGDGVGPEVVAEACKVLEATGLPLELVTLPWGSAYWHEHGRMMPADGIEVARGFDAILLGAVGDPSVPDDVSLWGLLFALRQQLDLWANVRPVKLLPGVPCPLAGRGPEDVDMLFVRENTEGEYSGVGGRVHAGYPGELAIESTVFTRAGVERVVRFAFEQARARRGRLTSATKSNAFRHTSVLWDEVVEEVSAAFPDVDVIGFRFGIQYGDMLGHRGLTHSLAFAFILGCLVALLAFREVKIFSLDWWKLAIYFFVVTASHGVLDALTNGGLGVAFFAPFSNERYFFPWRPIEVSPIGLRPFLSYRGLLVILSEIAWIWIPSVLLVLLSSVTRRAKTS